MNWRSRDTLEAWVEDFRRMYSPLRCTVAVQDGSAGADTGLTLIALDYATTQVYLQPDTTGSDAWSVTFEPRHQDLTLTPDQVDGLADELRVAAELCRFLEARSRGHSDVFETEA